MMRKKIIAVGYNLTEKTDPMAARFGHRANCIHSELMALKNFPKPLSQLCNYEIYNIRLLKNKALACSKPCKQCHLMLKTFGVSTIIYSDWGAAFNEIYL